MLTPRGTPPHPPHTGARRCRRAAARKPRPQALRQKWGAIKIIHTHTPKDQQVTHTHTLTERTTPPTHTRTTRTDDDMLTPTGYPPTPTQQPTWPTAHTAHS